MPCRQCANAAAMRAAADNVVLIGAMGAGKSVLGQRLAERFGLRFVDLDQVIEARTGVDIPTIFAFEGEAGFRVREKAVLAEFCAERGQVIATGGGAVLDPDNRAALRAAGLIVWLRVSVQQQLARVGRDRNRPLLRATDPQARLDALARVREPLYAQIADLEFDSDGLSPDLASERLAALIAAHWPRQGTT